MSKQYRSIPSFGGNSTFGTANTKATRSRGKSAESEEKPKIALQTIGIESSTEEDDCQGQIEAKIQIEEPQVEQQSVCGVQSEQQQCTHEVKCEGQCSEHVKEEIVQESATLVNAAAEVVKTTEAVIDVLANAICPVSTESVDASNTTEATTTTETDVSVHAEATETVHSETTTETDVSVHTEATETVHSETTTETDVSVHAEATETVHSETTTETDVSVHAEATETVHSETTTETDVSVSNETTEIIESTSTTEMDVSVHTESTDVTVSTNVTTPSVAGEVASCYRNVETIIVDVENPPFCHVIKSDIIDTPNCFVGETKDDESTCESTDCGLITCDGEVTYSEVDGTELTNTITKTKTTKTVVVVDDEPEEPEPTFEANLDCVFCLLNADTDIQCFDFGDAIFHRDYKLVKYTRNMTQKYIAHYEDLANMHLEVKPYGEALNFAVNSEILVTVTFTNPLKVHLSNAKFSIEGCSKKPYCFEIPHIRAGETVVCRTLVYPLKFGYEFIVARFTSTEIERLVTFTNIKVEHAAIVRRTINVNNTSVQQTSRRV